MSVPTDTPPPICVCRHEVDAYCGAWDCKQPRSVPADTPADRPSIPDLLDEMAGEECRCYSRPYGTCPWCSIVTKIRVEAASLVSELDSLRAEVARWVDEATGFQDANDALRADNQRLTAERDAAYQDAGSAEERASRIYDDERRIWTRERERLEGELRQARLLISEHRDRG